MRRAKITDKQLVVDILTATFVHDPHIGFLLEKSSNKNKLHILMDYVFEESFSKGEIYLNDDNTAVALWNMSKNEKLSWKYIWRNLSFLFQIGLVSTRRILKMDKMVHMCHPRTGPFAHLYTIGVLPESRGKGYARKMIEFMTHKLNNTQTTLYLETANSTNIGIYNKLGFHVFHTIRLDGHQLFCMNRIC